MNAYPNARVRLSFPAASPTVVGCSTDNFAIRPASFAGFGVKDAEAATSGTSRSLSNLGATGGVVHKAGQPFRILATAVNAISATTSNYAGVPTAAIASCGSTLPCSAAVGNLTWAPAVTAGVLAVDGSYSEAGNFTLQLSDVNFAVVDAGDGSTAAERTIASPVITVGRFVPDHFALAALAAPMLRTFDSGSCVAPRTFTYVGQPFGYTAVAQATVTAQNAAGGTTTNYTGSLWKIAATDVAAGYAPTPASPALDTSLATAPSLTSNNNGTGLIVGTASDKLSFTRTGVVAPFNANIALTWSVSDTTEAALTGNGSISTIAPLVFPTITFDAGAQMRFGLLRLTPAYGSVYVNLPVPVEAQYWDGARMATNTADSCTAIVTTAVAMGNFKRSLAACRTAVSASTVTLNSGRQFLTLLKPGHGADGSVDLSLQLGATASGSSCTAIGPAGSGAIAAGLPWLRGKWNGAAAFDQDPVTRASFGTLGSPLIWQREIF